VVHQSRSSEQRNAVATQLVSSTCHFMVSPKSRMANNSSIEHGKKYEKLGQVHSFLGYQSEHQHLRLLMPHVDIATLSITSRELIDIG